MTQQEAKEALRQGHKITHTYFTNDEYIELVNGREFFEDGVRVPSDWWWGKDYLQDGWLIRSQVFIS